LYGVSSLKCLLFFSVYSANCCINLAIPASVILYYYFRKDKFQDAEHMLMLAQAEKIRLLTEQVFLAY